MVATSSNRPLWRKWLTAKGLPSAFACELSIEEAQDAYNAIGDTALNALRVRAANPTPQWEDATPAGYGPDANPAVPAQREAPQADIIPASIPVSIPVSIPAANPAPALGNNPNTAAALQMLIASLTANNSLDADAVRAIMREELPNLVPVTRLEIVTPQGIKDCGSEPRHKLVPTLIQILSQKIPAALVGPAGSGKTTAAEQAAHALDIPFYIQGAVQGAHELLGFVDAHGRYQSTPFRQAFEHGGAICLDELDAGDAAGVLVLNSALANGHMPFPDQTEPVKRHPAFNVIACLNTYGTGADRTYVGRTQLDGATLDRFAFLAWGYDERLERAIVGASPDDTPAPRKLPASTMTADAWVNRVQALRSGAAKEKARVVISPRASLYGVRMIAAGMPQATIEDCLIWRGMDADLRRRIESAATL